MKDQTNQQEFELSKLFIFTNQVEKLLVPISGFTSWGTEIGYAFDQGFQAYSLR